MIGDMGTNDAISLLDSKLNRLKMEYEQYFLRINKQEPLTLREEVERLLRLYSSKPIHNTATKFRLNAITARYHIYRSHWTKTLRAIENGTYHRDVFKMNLATPKEEVSGKETTKPEKGKKMLETVFNDYINARHECKEGVKGLTYEKLKEVVLAQAEKTKKQYKCEEVHYKVVIKKGKAKVVIVPVKKSGKEAVN